MPVQEITRVLRDYERRDITAPVYRYGEEARSIAEEMARLISSRMDADALYGNLWEQFRADPQATLAELNGALEVLVEADPGLTRRLDALLERYRRVTMPAESRPDERSPAGQDQDATLQSAESLAITGDGRSRSGDFERGTYLYGDTLSSRESVGDGIGTTRPADEEAA